jgi:hypothetical protein
METQTFTFASSLFVPVAIGFFVLGDLKADLQLDTEQPEIVARDGCRLHSTIQSTAPNWRITSSFLLRVE